MKYFLCMILVYEKCVSHMISRRESHLFISVHPWNMIHGPRKWEGSQVVSFEIFLGFFGIFRIFKNFWRFFFRRFFFLERSNTEYFSDWITYHPSSLICRRPLLICPSFVARHYSSVSCHSSYPALFALFPITSSNEICVWASHGFDVRYTITELRRQCFSF